MFKKVIKIKLSEGADLPQKHGNLWDLAAKKKYELSIPRIESRSVVIHEVSYHVTLVDTGVSMTLPKHYGAKIYPRSSLFKNHGCIMANHVGIIEWNYSGQWYLNLIKLTDACEYKVIPFGFRLAQFEVYLLPDAPWYMKILDLFNSGFRFKKVDVLSTYRGGFGSTGDK